MVLPARRPTTSRRGVTAAATTRATFRGSAGHATLGRPHETPGSDGGPVCEDEGGGGGWKSLSPNREIRLPRIACMSAELGKKGPWVKGRKPTLTPLKLIKGNPGRRALPKDEPVPPSGAPDPPEHLTDRARAVWPAVAAALDEMGVLSKADGLAIERLCECYAEIVEAQEALGGKGGRYQKVKTKSGGVMVRIHPAVSVLQDADRRFRAWAAELGLTPASRTRIRVDGQPKPNQSPAAKYFA